MEYLWQETAPSAVLNLEQPPDLADRKKKGVSTRRKEGSETKLFFRFLQRLSATEFTRRKLDPKLPVSEFVPVFLQSFVVVVVVVVMSCS